MRAGRLKSRLQVYAPIETQGRLASTTTAWQPRETVWGEFLSPARRLRNYGAGEVTTGSAAVDVRSSARLQTRDGVEVVSGPERGTRWRVVAVDRSDPARAQALLEPYSGSFT